MARQWMWGENMRSVWHPEWQFSQKRLHPDVIAGQAVVNSIKGNVRWAETHNAAGSYEANLERWRKSGCKILGGGVILYVKARSSQQVADTIAAVDFSDSRDEPPHPTVLHIVCEGTKVFGKLLAFIRDHPAIRVPLPKLEVLEKNCDGTVPVRVKRIYVQSQLNRIAEALLKLHNDELMLDPFYPAIDNRSLGIHLVWRLTSCVFGRRGQRIKKAMSNFSSKDLPYPCVITLPGQLMGLQTLTIDTSNLDARYKESYFQYIHNLVSGYACHKGVDTAETCPNYVGNRGAMAHTAKGKRRWKPRRGMSNHAMQQSSFCVGAHRDRDRLHHQSRSTTR